MLSSITGTLPVSHALIGLDSIQYSSIDGPKYDLEVIGILHAHYLFYLLSFFSFAVFFIGWTILYLRL